MIDFRYHIVSIVAVFLALALGLFLGSTTLQSTVTHNLDNQAKRVTGEYKHTEAINGQLRASLGDEQALTKEIEPFAVEDRLTGDAVALVSAPGVDGSLVKSVVNTLQLAGATVTANVALQSAYIDPTQDAELGQLATSLALPNHTLPNGNGATKVSSILADVLLARPGHRTVSRSHVNETLNALSDGKFISVSGNLPNRPANMAVLLLADPTSSGAANIVQTQNTELVTLAKDLRGSSSAAVVAGPDPTPGNSASALATARNDSTLTKNTSTVDFDTSSSPDPAAGRIAIVLALADAASSGTVGAYGLGENQVLPSPSPSP
ncbi:MAG TPA: copper transporter [Mycobacteriales bacterium]|nr:copper transporter [Mycobacteriales bacterium]